MNERRIIGGFGFRVDVFEPSPSQTLAERLLRKPHLERVRVIGGLMDKDVAKGMAEALNKGDDGLIYKAVREIPPDFII